MYFHGGGSPPVRRVSVSVNWPWGLSRTRNNGLGKSEGKTQERDCFQVKTGEKSFLRAGRVSVSSDGNP